MSAPSRACSRRTRMSVEFSVKGPVAVTLDEPSGSGSGASGTQQQSPGCCVLDLLFPVPAQVSELALHNYYTAWLTVLVRVVLSNPVPVPPPPPPAPGSAPPPENGSSSSSSATCAALPATQPSGSSGPPAPSDKTRRESGWLLSIARRVLMPSPHLETGSHDYISLLATESAVPWNDLVAMRLVLRQPSPSWHTFHVEEIHVFAEPPRRARRPARAEADGDSVLSVMRRQTLAALQSSTRQSSYEINSLPAP